MKTTFDSPEDDSSEINEAIQHVENAYKRAAERGDARGRALHDEALNAPKNPGIAARAVARPEGTRRAARLVASHLGLISDVELTEFEEPLITAILQAANQDRVRLGGPYPSLVHAVEIYRAAGGSQALLRLAGEDS